MTCKCGAPAVMLKSGECKKCYRHRYHIEHYVSQKKPRIRRECSVEDCTELAVGRGYCKKHYGAWFRHGDPLVVQKPGRARTSNSYAAIHILLKRTRGEASNYDCIDCGAKAQEWSYNNNGIDEVTGWHNNGSGDKIKVTYSTDLNQYDPRDKDCHRKYDHHQK